MRSLMRLGSLPDSSNSSRSRLLEIKMSMEGDIVLKNSRRLSYFPVRMKSVRTLFLLDAQMSLPTGSPMRFA